ncbi:MAG: dCTP deaminase [Vampirovibrionales bacterium]
MTLLHEQQIMERLVHPHPDQRLVMTPLVAPEAQLGPSSIDVRLGTEFQLQERNIEGVMHPMQALQAMHPSAVNEYTSAYWVKPPAKRVGGAMKTVVASMTQPFILHPGEFALACTLEHFQIPLDLAARLEGRSTWGRLGLLIHATAGFVDPGFRGALTFELANISHVPLTLYPGVRIAQMCFFRSDAVTQLPYHQKKYTKYSYQPGAKASAYYQDPEYAQIAKYLSR